MFTGIVETQGTVVARGARTLVIAPKKSLTGLAVGESVSVDGVCLTVDRLSGRHITFRLLPETVRVSTLSVLRAGSKVNLERALRVGDRVGGHLLLGHVDAQGTVAARSKAQGKGTVTLAISVPRQIARVLAPKGPIGLDGVSLTLDPVVGQDEVRVHLVSHTMKVTALGAKRVGDRVNLEVDLITKYLLGMLY